MAEQNNAIYLDYHSTTPVDARVVDAMLPYLRENFGNPASRSHAFGWTAKAAVDLAREQVAQLLGAQPREVVFTSGATESDNLALAGVAARYRHSGTHIITSQIEHKAVLDPASALEKRGFQVTRLPVGADGIVDPEAVREAIRPDTILCSIMMANNEVGTIQPVAHIGRICKEMGVFFHCDAAQAMGRVPVSVKDAAIDLLSLSAHKMYGPKGIGALYIRRGRPWLRLEPLILGGGHESGLRSGTLPVHQIVGMGVAASLAGEELALGHELERQQRLRDRLLEEITNGLDKVHVNGSMEHRLVNNLNISFDFVDAEALMLAMPQLAVSSGSACTSATMEPSHVLMAMGYSRERAASSIRFGLGRFTTESDISRAVELVVGCVPRLRELSPFYRPAP